MSQRWWFYVQPMGQVYLETAVMFVLWTAAMLLLRGRARRIVAAVCAVAAVALVLFFTVYARGGDDRVLVLTPFITFVYAKTEPEFYRTLYMNVLLFMPLGLSLPFALPERCRRRVLVTVGVGVLLSVGVEAAQLLFRLGRCETDDVLMNTLGVLLGCLSFLLCTALKRLRDRLKEKEKRTR